MPESKAEKKTRQKPQEATQIKVILAVSDKGNLNELKDNLVQGGLDVTPMAHGFEALRQLLGQGADVIVLDNNLADIKGPQLACLIKSSESLIPIVLLTNGKQEESNFWTLACPADAYVNANRPQELLSTIKEVTKKAQDAGNTSKPSNHLRGLSGQLKAINAQESYESLCQDFLIERLVAGIISNLLDNIEPRKKFLEKYFQATSQLFGVEAIGIALLSANHPWACFQTKAQLAKKSYEAMVADLENRFNPGARIALERHGELSDDNGVAITHQRILPIIQDQTTVGALIFATSEKKDFDQLALQAMAELQVQLLPIMRLILANQELETLHEREQYRSSTDVLTGLYNLEFLVGFLQQQLLFSYRQRSPVGLVIIDIDHLKAVNESFGYEMGDLVLSTIGNKMLGMTRASDLLARYGGGSFVVVMPNTDINGARVVAEKVCLEIQQLKFIRGAEGNGPHVTVSIGCASFNMDDLNPETILRDAKLALQRSKEHGGNRVAI